MSVLIKGMEMPKNCRKCNFRKLNKYDGCTFDCIVTGKGLAENEMSDKKRPYHCPLVELPSKHGRLVDADLAMEKLATDKREAYTKHDVWLKFSTYGAPTVLEAEE